MEDNFLKAFVELSFSASEFPVKASCYESRLSVSGSVRLLIQFDRVITFSDSFDRVNAFQQLINTVKV